jgi:FAD/FMN-containing dehydrogenase
MGGNSAYGARLSRRGFIAGAAGVLATTWLPVGRSTAAPGSTPPPDFPSGVPLYRRVFENWAKSTRVEDVWTCSPATPDDVVTVANWAARSGYRLRPCGMMHNWSPLTVTGDETDESRLVLVDTRSLNSIRIVDGYATPAVTVGAGATMDELLTFLEAAGLGFGSVPAPGDITIGGALAVDAHGAAVPARGERRVPGHTYGSLSNLVLSLTVVAWNDERRRYEERVVDRRHPLSEAFLVSLGRTFVTTVTLQAGANQNLRCQSFVDIPATELFAAPNAAARRTFTSFLDAAGRAEAIWYPFTDRPWLKVWSIAPTKPLLSRQVDQPYNYPFSDNVPDELADLANSLVTGSPESTPVFGASMYAVTVAGLAASASFDIWGPSKNTLLYIKPTTLRVDANGYAVVTDRLRVQAVLHDVTSNYTERVQTLAAEGRYPANMPLEIRVTGLDDPSDVEAVGRNARIPALSALRPRRASGDDVVVWFNALSLPGTEGADEFYLEFEQWLQRYADGSGDVVRPEWSKGWGYTTSGPWSDPSFLGSGLRSLYPDLVRTAERFDEADPHGVFSNDFLEVIL